MGMDRWIYTIPLRIRSLFRRGRVEEELREEFRFHFDQRLEEELARGVPEDEARRIALLAMGRQDRHMEECRDARRVSLLENLVQDVRYGARLLRGAPAFTTVVVLTLAVGIGANTAVFSVVDGVLLRPAPFEEIENLVMVWGTDRSSGTLRAPVSVPDFIDLEAASTQLRDLAAFSGSDVNVSLAGVEPIRSAALAVTEDLLPLIGVQPLVGHLFEAGDNLPGGPRVVLIGEGLWERMFARDLGVVGRTVLVNDERFTVNGVIPRGAELGLSQALSAAGSGRGLADRSDVADVDVWLPLMVDSDASPRYLHNILLVGRVRGSIGGAQRELDHVAAELETLYRVNAQRGLRIEPLSDVVFGPVRVPLLVLLGAVGFVLLVACVNVANLMLARGSTRSREVAVRAAIGASGGRLASQFLVEALLLTLAGALVGVLLAFFSLKLLLAIAPAAIPRIGEVGIDGRVLACTLLVSVVAAVVFSLIPALGARRIDLQKVLRSESSNASASPQRARLRSLLPIAEVALAVVLLVGGGLLLRSFWNVQGIDPGFLARGTLKAEFQLSSMRYPVDDWPRLTEIHAFNDALLARTAALPGVETAAITRNHPLDVGSTNAFTIVGREEWSEGLPELSIRSVSPDYFSTLRVRLLSGRGIEGGDGTDSPPIMVLNETAARILFPAGDAISERIAVWGAQRFVVGIVSDERILGLTAAAPPAVYLPLAQVPPRDGNETLILRTRADPATLVRPLRTLFGELDPGLAVFGVEPLTQTVARSIGQRRFTAVLVSTFALVAVLLALIGVHGVLRYSVAQRRREIGIRMAIGADEGRIVRSIMAEGMRVALIGLALGIALASGLSRVLSSMLHEITPGDPLTLAGVALLLGTTAVVACWLPARAASRTDPARTLREI
jgi:predicted permease